MSTAVILRQQAIISHVSSMLSGVRKRCMVISVLALVGFVCGRGALDFMVLQDELSYVKSAEEAADTSAFMSLLLSVLDGAQSVLAHTPAGVQPQVVGSGILHGDARVHALRHVTQKTMRNNPLHIMANDDLTSINVQRYAGRPSSIWASADGQAYMEAVLESLDSNNEVTATVLPGEVTVTARFLNASQCMSVMSTSAVVDRGAGVSATGPSGKAYSRVLTPVEAQVACFPTSMPNGEAAAGKSVKTPEQASPVFIFKVRTSPAE